MAIITISRGTFSGGLQVAECVAEKLGYRCVSREVLVNAAKQYGVLEIEGANVTRIIEWDYWKTYPEEKQRRLQICNSGIYAAHKDELVQYLGILEKRPHKVKKERRGRLVEVEEFFITDLVELMKDNGLKVGYALAEDENEVMGVDDLPSLLKAQEIYKRSSSEFGIGNSE